MPGSGHRQRRGAGPRAGSQMGETRGSRQSSPGFRSRNQGDVLVRGNPPAPQPSSVSRSAAANCFRSAAKSSRLERLIGGDAAPPPEERSAGESLAVEVILLQVPHQDLLRLRELELVDDAHEVREPLPVHPAVLDQPLAVRRRSPRVERAPGSQLERDHDELVRNRARDAVGRGERRRRDAPGPAARPAAAREVLAVLADPVVGAPVEVEEALAVPHEHVAEIARVVDAVAVLRLVRVGIVEVALEEAGLRRDAADLADRLGVVGDLAVARRAAAGGHSPPRSLEDLHGRVGDLADLPRGSPLLPERADRGLGRAVQLEHVLEPEPAHEPVDVGRRRAVADRVAQPVPRIAARPRRGSAPRRRRTASRAPRARSAPARRRSSSSVTP